MATDKQTEANRANAKRSTGPRTPKGRARSSLNALKHGLSTRDFVVFEREREAFETFLAAWSLDLRPVGPLEEEIFAQITQAAWNMRRVRRAESNLTGEKHRFFKDSQDDPLTKCHKIADLNHYARYYARNERSFYRALRELHVLHTDRALREVLCPPPPPVPAEEESGLPAAPENLSTSDPGPRPAPPPLTSFAKLTKRTQIQVAGAPGSRKCRPSQPIGSTEAPDSTLRGNPQNEANFPPPGGLR